MSSANTGCGVRIEGRDVPEAVLLTQELSRARVALALLKAKLGPKGIASLLEDEYRQMQNVMRTELESSAGRWSCASAEIYAVGCRAEDFFGWFHSRLVASDPQLLTSHPEHYLIVAAEGGGTDVIETTGHWQLPSRFIVKLGVPAEEAFPERADIDPDLPLRMAGYGILADGTVVAKVLHQFANTAKGFRGRLGIYFPANAAPERIIGHRWHLAIEFRNWISDCLSEMTASKKSSGHVA